MYLLMPVLPKVLAVKRKATDNPILYMEIRSLK